MLNRRLSVKVIAVALSLALMAGLSLPCRAQDFETLYEQGRSALQNNQPEQALRLLRQAAQIAGSQRQQITDPDERARYAERGFDAYLLLALAHLQLNQPAQAAEAIERSRARSLAEILQQRASRQSNPPQPLTFQQIQRSIDAGTVLLYYALTEEHLLMVAVSRTEVRGVARKVDGKQLAVQVQQLRATLSLPPQVRADQQRTEWQQQSQQLYAQLIAPVQGMLNNAQRVLLCPDGILSQLPWAALIVKTENGKPVYWIERVALHITPSIGVYRQARAKQPVSQGAAIVALAQYNSSAPASLTRSAATPPQDATTLGDLPSVQQEVQALQRLFGKEARVAMNAQATPQRARQLAANARVAHFACHARAHATDPFGSALLLAPAGTAAGQLTTAEVTRNWQLRADLVMLSASESALGVVRRHEGAYSLARAFLIAGARSVGASLFCPADDSTALLMRSFYQHYTKGVPKDEALRRAQLELRRTPRYADPHYWAGFILIGDYRNATRSGSRR